MAEKNKYLDIVNSYGEVGRGDQLTGKALEVIKKREEAKHGRERDDSLERQLARAKRVEKMENIGKQLIDAVNGESAEDVAEALFFSIANSHRTLQQSAVKAMVEFFRMYSGVRFDARNQCAVAASAVITEVLDDLYVGFPLI